MASRGFLLFSMAAHVAFGAESIDLGQLVQRFDGIGGLSGGGGTSRLLVDYPEQYKSEIMDYLFLPNFGASLQICKVEIGGDAQSTDGSEPSHMHSSDDLDFKRGYEWWIMKEAKRRNPNVKLYGLSWAFPGWIGNGTKNPFQNPSILANYTTQWLQGARDVHGLEIDYIGIWNERAYSADYIKLLRKYLDHHGFKNTQIVAADGTEDVCDGMKEDQSFADTVSVVGLHYPYDGTGYYNSNCTSLGKPLWASEESSSYDDLNGAACWARVLSAHFVLHNITSSIMWNLVGSYYYGTNWYASSMMNADQPWSGYYEVAPVIWATAHYTQFTEIGWKFTAKGSGSGQLKTGGYYVTLADPNSKNFTIVIEKIPKDHGLCVRPALPPDDLTVTGELVKFQIQKGYLNGATKLSTWRSNFAKDEPMLFEKMEDTLISDDGEFEIFVDWGDVVTLSTIQTAQKGAHPKPPASKYEFPLPFESTIQEAEPSKEAIGFADQIGIFEVHPKLDGSDELTMRQMVTQDPITWQQQTRAPVTVLGNFEWQDIEIEASLSIPDTMGQYSGACVATRSDQYWANAVSLCVTLAGNWSLIDGGWRLDGTYFKTFANGTVSSLTPGKYYRLKLVTVNGLAQGFFEGEQLFENVEFPDIGVGFAAIGSTGYFPMEFDYVRIDRAGSNWNSTQKKCKSPAKVGSVLTADACTRNARRDEGLMWELRSNWQLVHTPSGLCAQADLSSRGQVHLAECASPGDDVRKSQEFRNRYSNIRQHQQELMLQDGSSSYSLQGTSSGSVFVDHANEGMFSY